MVNDNWKMSNRPKTISSVKAAVPDREGGRFDIASRALPLLRDLVPRPTLFAQLRRTPHRLKARLRRPRRQAALRRTPLLLQLPLSLQRVRKHPLESEEGAAYGAALL